MVEEIQGSSWPLRNLNAIQKELKEASIRRIDDIQAFAPNIYINRTPGIASGAAITIRGVSSSEVDKSFEPAIGVVMDGMYLGTASGVLLQNFDIERIEVLRGPQGTLFGKNTTGGVLNIIRTPVTMEYGADISMTIGDFGRQDFKAVINVPIIEDKMGLKIFGASIQSDGHVYNSTLKRDVGGDDKVNLGFAAQWEPNENLSIKLHHEIIELISKQITEGLVIGWFEGKMEFGARALGNRSILANPCDPQMKAKVNKVIKKREGFRPFAPIVKIEEQTKYFDLVRTCNLCYCAVTSAKSHNSAYLYLGNDYPRTHLGYARGTNRLYLFRKHFIFWGWDVCLCGCPKRYVF